DFDLLYGQGPRENPVVRSYEKIVRRLHGDCFAPAADPRVHYGDVNGALWKKPATRRQRESAAANIAGQNFVRDVHYHCPRIDAEDHSFRCADEPITDAEIGG